MDVLPELLAESVNPFLLGLLLPLPFVGTKRPVAWKFYTACALSIGVAVALAELGKARVVWAGHPGFPSGHETMALTAATCLVCRDRRWLAVGVPLAALQAWALITGYFHTPEDVTGALVTGILPPLAAHWIGRRR